MTEVITEIPTIKLIPIFTSAEEKLQANLDMIIRKLQYHDKLISSNRNMIQQSQFQYKLLSEKTESKAYENKIEVMQRISEMNEKLNVLQNKDQQLENIHGKLSMETEQITQKLNDLSEKYNNHVLNKLKRLDSVNEQIFRLNIESKNIEKVLHEKENRNEAENMGRQIKQLSNKLNVSNEQIKFIEFKLEKMDTLSKKSQINLKKDQERLKEFEEQIKKQIRNSQTIKIQAIDPQLLNHQQNSEPSIERPQSKVRRFESLEVSNINRSVSRQKQNLDSKKSLTSMDERFLKSINQRLIKLQMKIQHKSQNRNSVIESEVKTENKANNHHIQQLSERINSIKPQLVKIWAKMDCIDEKMVTFDKKVDEKSRQISSIMEQLKQSNFSKIDDRFKAFQTQFYANLKEIKTKLDSKTSNLDFEKNLKLMSDRLQTISEQIILKSDKVEVKKALLFLESKIKEIILVISEEEENERDALITKKQIKCISCDKEIQKFLTASNSAKYNWDNLPNKELVPENLGKFGMTAYGSLNKKLRRLQSKDLPVLSKKSTHNYRKNVSQHLDNDRENL